MIWNFFRYVWCDLDLWFDIVGWVTRKASGLQKILHKQATKVLQEVFREPDLTWSILQKNRLVSVKY